MPVILLGTLLFIVLGAFGFFSASFCGQMAGLGRFIAITTAFCCWISWVIVYMSQQYPLIVPIRKVGDQSVAIHVGSGHGGGHKAESGNKKDGHHGDM
eukprot:CAMPEP_0174281846 /NCGR_PEP_ID=MMETSP0809-20121228/2252_1 /TAXON_ID=73025 ORGANISM="Eutreptiella gymnastica-like, Strain CCMP1594" /NCGR_SAMPLE_ID=MMETSP0809 /ASSEMBLY_ACC=CAM_ASM_000658 /LENGTH=97 /DNA_ID=CAMNT_0015375651 /DNA_START=31 /DNA_END=324 /DNA_ORIENTATION=-